MTTLDRGICVCPAACALQCVVEASVGQRWVTERGIRVPKITRVVEIFLNATGHAGVPEHNLAVLASTV